MSELSHLSLEKITKAFTSIPTSVFQRGSHALAHDYEAMIEIMQDKIESQNKELHELQDRLEEAQRKLKGEVLNAGAREQRRIAQDLHDSVCQQLLGITFLAKVLENKLRAKSLPETKDIQEILEVTHETLAQTRSMTKGLLGWEIDAKGILPALKQLTIGIQKLFRVSCSLRCDPTFTIHNPAVANHLYRIAQEAIGNAIKHGKAREIEVSIVKESDQIVLTVADDGIGLPEKQLESTGLGIRIMNYRAQMIGACLAFQKRSAKGTLIKCTIPAGAL